jgi:hypothetical protein
MVRRWRLIGHFPILYYPPPTTNEMTALRKVDTKCTAPSRIPTVSGNTVRSFYYARTKACSERKLDHCLTL